MMQRWTKQCFWISLISILLLSCNGVSDSDVSTSQGVAGIWTGAFISDVRGHNGASIGIVAANDSALFINLGQGGVEYSGNLSASNSTVTGSMTGYTNFGVTFADGSEKSSFIISGEVIENNKLSGSYSGVADGGSFNFVYSDIYERSSSIDKISANWTLTDGGGGLTLSVDSDGLLTGSNILGCVYNGSVKLIDVKYNVYEIVIDVSSCDALIGNYAGLAFLADATVENDTLVIGLASDKYSWSFRLARS